MRRLTALFVLGFSTASLAIAGTTGRLTGNVREAAGQPLPGATVSVSSPTEIGGAKSAVTEADGNFQFPALSPGDYSVRIELSGFVAQERNEVHVHLDGTTELNVEMPLASFAEELTVLDETPIVDPAQVSTAQNFTPGFLQGVAVTNDRRDYLNVLDMAPGVDGRGSPRVFGSTEGENVFMIDGLNTTDAWDSTYGTDLAFDAIQEISFQTGGFEAEYGNAIGGVVNVVTKSGGNEFSGSLDFRYYDNSFFENGDHFDRDADEVSFLDSAATFGGPILRDRLWFFAAYEQTDAQSTPTLSPTTQEAKAATYLAKVTWQATPGWRLTGKWNADPFEVANGNASQFVAPEATLSQSFGGEIYSADASGVLGSNRLWNLAIGINRPYLDSYPHGGDFETAGHLNLVSGEFYGNAFGAHYSERDRDEYKTNLTWFVDDRAGSHELKAGFEHGDLTYWSHDFALAGGFQYRDLTSDAWYGDANPSPIPFLMVQSTDPGGITSTGRQNTLYLQDAWKVRPDLTLKLGVRYDEVAYTNDAGTGIADLHQLQPRLGLAWDIGGDARNVLRASWGRFMHPSSTALPDYAHVHRSASYWWHACSTEGAFSSPEQCRAETGGLGWQWSAGPDGWDPNGWYLDPSSDVFGSEPTRIAAGLAPAYADELILGFERELADRTSIELSYVDKATRHLFEDTCQGNLQGLTQEDDAYCPYFTIANLEGLRRDYRAVILKFESRAVDWMWLLASYTYSESRGNLDYSLGANPDFDFCPEQCVNSYGHRADDRRHRVKLNGFFELPANLRLGVDAFWSSAFAYAETQTPLNVGYGTEFLEPRGSRRANDNYQLDLSLTYHLSLGPVGAQLIGSVVNALDSEQSIGVCEDILGCGSYAFSDPTEWQTPRRFEVGLRFEF